MDLAALVTTKKGSMNLRAAAKEIGISPTTLSHVERGLTPDMKTLHKLAGWLGISANDFAGIDLQWSTITPPIERTSLANAIIAANIKFNSSISSIGHE